MLSHLESLSPTNSGNPWTRPRSRPKDPLPPLRANESPRQRSCLHPEYEPSIQELCALKGADPECVEFKCSHQLPQRETATTPLDAPVSGKASRTWQLVAIALSNTCGWPSACAARAQIRR